MDVFGDESSFSKNRTIHKYPLHRNSQVNKQSVCATQIYLACIGRQMGVVCLGSATAKKSILDLYASRDTMWGPWQMCCPALSLHQTQ